MHYIWSDHYCAPAMLPSHHPGRGLLTLNTKVIINSAFQGIINPTNQWIINPIHQGIDSPTKGIINWGGRRGTEYLKVPPLYGIFYAVQAIIKLF